MTTLSSQPWTHNQYIQNMIQKVTLKNELFTFGDIFELRIQSPHFLSLTKNVCYIGAYMSLPSGAYREVWEAESMRPGALQ